MKTTTVSPRTVLAATTLALVVFTTGCSKKEPVTPAQNITQGATQSTPASSGHVASKLGDLTPFRSIAADVSAMVNKGELAAAKTRIKDLELAWDSAEAGLKPRAADDWHLLDKSIDNALKALRADTPNAAECKTAMDSLLQKMNTLEGK